jgi:PhnB protein
VGLHIYVEDVDGFARRAESAGVEVLEPVTDKFYGDRSVTFRDPCGHIWSFATHKEDLSPAEIQKRLAALGGAK